MLVNADFVASERTVYQNSVTGVDDFGEDVEVETEPGKGLNGDFVVVAVVCDVVECVFDQQLEELLDLEIVLFE